MGKWCANLPLFIQSRLLGACAAAAAAHAVGAEFGMPLSRTGKKQSSPVFRQNSLQEAGGLMI